MDLNRQNDHAETNGHTVVIPQKVVVIPPTAVVIPPNAVVIPQNRHAAAVVTLQVRLAQNGCAVGFVINAKRIISWNQTSDSYLITWASTVAYVPVLIPLVHSFVCLFYHQYVMLVLLL